MNLDDDERPAYDDGSALGNRRVLLMQWATFLRHQNLGSTWIESDPLAARAVLTGENGVWLLSGFSVPGNRTVLISHLPARVPVSKREACAKVVASINSGLSSGSFKLNPESGWLTFRTTMPARTKELDEERMSAMLKTHREVVDRHFGALMLVIYGDSTCAAPSP